MLVPLTEDQQKTAFSALNTSELTENKVIQELQKKPDKGIAERKEMLDLKKEEVAKAKEKTAEVKKEIVKKKAEIKEEEKKVQEKKAAVVQKKEENKRELERYPLAVREALGKTVTRLRISGEDEGVGVGGAQGEGEAAQVEHELTVLQGNPGGYAGLVAAPGAGVLGEPTRLAAGRRTGTTAPLRPQSRPNPSAVRVRARSRSR